ncbi:MAG: kelch repeat-containing protein, partial [Acidobacteriota bacterium]
MTYDAARHRIVVFGGSGAGGFFGDTWEFDGNAWVRGPAAPAGLYARAYTPLAYDSARGVSVVFSGVTSCYPGGQPADTWEYDGTSWRQGPAAPPGMVARYGHAMDYDAARGVIVLVGGFTVDGSDQPLNDVWEYDGSQWRSGTPLPPLVFPRLAHSTTYDLTRRRLVIFGGGDDPDPTMGNAFGDVWEGDGSSWDPGATTPPLLGARRYHASFFDSARARIVIFGGIDQGHAERGDVWEYGAVRDAIVVAAGHGAPNANRIAVIDETGQPTATDFLAYQAGTWGATGRAGQLSGDALAEIVTGPGPGPTLGPQARAFTNRGTGLAKVNFYAYGTLRYGVAATAASIDGDAWDEIVTGPGGGPVFGPHVRGWNVDGAGVTPISAVSFFAYATLKYGARPDGGDLDADGYGEILTGPGPGAMFGPHVRGWNVDGGAVQAMSKASFFAFQATTHGVEVAGGDVDLDGFAEIAAAPGPDPGAAPRAAGFDYDGATVSALPGFATTPGATAYGGRIALGDLSASDAAELLLSPGPDPAAAAAIETYAYDGAALSGVLPPLLAFSTMAYGVNVAGGILGL